MSELARLHTNIKAIQEQARSHPPRPSNEHDENTP